MATVEVTPPFSLFVDLRSGVPIDAGYVYIGEANQDPVSKPVAVFWDAALTIPAPNPARTSAGTLRRSGSPGKLFVGGTGDYSMMVADKGNTPLYTVPSRSREGLGDITLSAGENLYVEANAQVFFKDGSLLRIGSNDGVPVQVIYADNARFSGNIVPLDDSTQSVGLADRRVDVFADVINANNIGDTTARSLQISNGVLPTADLQYVGLNTKPFNFTSTEELSSNDVKVRRVAQPAAPEDTLFLSARTVDLALAHVVTLTTTPALSAENLNIASVTRTSAGLYEVNLTQPIHLDSVVTPSARQSPPVICMARMSTTTKIIVEIFNVALVATDPQFFNITVKGPGLVAGAASIPQLPL